MAEVVGLVASVVQLAGAGLKLSQALYQYADGVATADRRIKNIANEVKLTSLVIQELGDIFKQDETANLISENAVQTANETIKECSSVFTEIEVIINKSKPGKMGRLMLPFRDNKIELLRSQIDKLKSTLELLMQVLIHAHQVSSSKLNREAEARQREEIKQLLENKKQSTKKYEESLRNFSISDGSTAVDDGDRSLQEEDEPTPSSDPFKAASIIGSTINPTTIATCVNHVRQLLANIENLQSALANSVDGDDNSDHHQRAIGSYFVARSYLDSYLLGNSKANIPETQTQPYTSLIETENPASNDEQAVVVDEVAPASSAAPTYFEPRSGTTVMSNLKTTNSTTATIPPTNAIAKRRKIEKEMITRDAIEQGQTAKEKPGDNAGTNYIPRSLSLVVPIRNEHTEAEPRRLNHYGTGRQGAEEEIKHGPGPSAGTQVQQPNNQYHSESTANSKMRKRTKTGCLTCRKRRIKCSEERPICTNCVRSRRQCEGYNQRVIYKPPIGDWPNHPGVVSTIQYHTSMLPGASADLEANVAINSGKSGPASSTTVENPADDQSDAQMEHQWEQEYQKEEPPSKKVPLVSTISELQNHQDVLCKESVVETEPEPEYGASDDSDVDAAAGWAALRMAEEQESADEARRASGGTGLFSSHAYNYPRIDAEVSTTRLLPVSSHAHI